MNRYWLLSMVGVLSRVFGALALLGGVPLSLLAGLGSGGELGGVAVATGMAASSVFLFVLLCAGGEVVDLLISAEGLLRRIEGNTHPKPPDPVVPDIPPLDSTPVVDEEVPEVTTFEQLRLAGKLFHEGERDEAVTLLRDLTGRDPHGKAGQRAAELLESMELQ